MTAKVIVIQWHKPNTAFAEADMTTSQLAERGLVQSTPDARAHRVLG